MYCYSNPINCIDNEGLRRTWLYELYDGMGNFLKNGITRNPGQRLGAYKRKYGRDVQMVLTRHFDDDIPETKKYGKNNREALDAERQQNMTTPGPLNKERYIKRGLVAGGLGETDWPGKPKDRGSWIPGFIELLFGIVLRDPTMIGSGLSGAVDPLAGAASDGYDGWTYGGRAGIHPGALFKDIY